jgi:hypothetical protein
MQDIIDAYNRKETDESDYWNNGSGTEETYETLEPTGSYPSDTADTQYLDAAKLKSCYIYSVWYDVTTDNPADYDSIASEKAFALKGVFYFNTPLTCEFAAVILRGDQVVLTRNVNMYDNVTAEADFSAGLEGLGTFAPGDYTIELYFGSEMIAKTEVMRVK